MGKRLLFALLLCIALSFTANAVEVRCGSTRLTDAYLENGVTWVPLRSAANAWGLPVSWDGTAASAGGVRVQPGQQYLTASGRCFYTAPVRLTGGVTYVPIRPLASAVGAEVSWDEATQTVRLGAARGIADGASVYDPDELYWLSRIISAEAKGESLEGKIAVGNVILSRVASDAFPDSIYDVIFDREDGVQFSPTANGAIYDAPGEESIAAAKLCLEGVQTAAGCLYFFNPDKSSGSWIRRNCTYVRTIGDHAFYA